MNFPKVFPLVWNPFLPSLDNCLTVDVAQIEASVVPLWQNPDDSTFPSLSQGQFTYFQGRAQPANEDLTLSGARALARREKRGKPMAVSSAFVFEIVARRREVRNYNQAATNLCMRAGDALIVLRCTMAGRSSHAIAVAKEFMFDEARPETERDALSNTWFDVLQAQQKPIQIAATTKKAHAKAQTKKAGLNGQVTARHKQSQATISLGDVAQKGTVALPTPATPARLPAGRGKKAGGAKGPTVTGK